MAESTRLFFRIFYDEIQSPAFLAVRGAAWKVYTVLRQFSEEKMAARIYGSFSYYARRCGVAKANFWKQCRRLERLGLVKFVSCRPGRLTKRDDGRLNLEALTEIEVRDMHGEPLSFRKRNVIGANSNLNHFENETKVQTVPSRDFNTDREEGAEQAPPQLKTREGEGDHREAAAFLRETVGIRHIRLIQELTGIASLTKLRAAWAITKAANERRRLSGKSMQAYFVGVVRNQFADGLPKQPTRPEAPGDGPHYQGVARSAGTVKEKGGAAAAAGEGFTKEELAAFKSRAASAQRPAVRRLGDSIR